MPKFIELQHQCLEYADKKEIHRLDDDIEKTREGLKKFVFKTDYTERISKVESELWKELALKVEKTTFKNKIEYLADEIDKERLLQNKAMSSLREIVDRLRRKVDEVTHSMLSF